MSRRKRKRKPRWMRLGFKSYRHYENETRRAKRDAAEKKEMLAWLDRRTKSDKQMIQDARDRTRYHSMRLQEIANGNKRT